MNVVLVVVVFVAEDVGMFFVSVFFSSTFFCPLNPSLVLRVPFGTFSHMKFLIALKDSGVHAGAKTASRM